MTIGNAFTYVFDDRDWITKVAIGGLLTLFSFLLIPIPILYGYYLEIIKRTRDSAETILPTWSGVGEHFGNGLTVTIGSFIYYIPLLILQICNTFVSAGGIQSDSFEVASLLLLALACANGIYGIAVGFILPAAYIRHLETGTLGGMFQVGKIWRIIRAQLGRYVLVLVGSIIAMLVGAVAGAIPCGLLLPWGFFWTALVSANLIGQYWRSVDAQADS